MSAAFIIDASITLAWCFADEATAATIEVQEGLKDDSALAPAHWFLEIANSLAMAERRRRTTSVTSDAFIALLGEMDIEVDEESSERAFLEILPLARAHRLTVYDAVYLELAVRRQLPLATLDEELRAAATQLGVKLLGK